MLEFHSVCLDDRERLLPLLLECDRGCEYTFSNIYLYRNYFDTKTAYYKNSAVVMFGSAGSYLMFLGDDDPADILGQMEPDRNGKFRFYAVPDKETEILRAAFPGRIESLRAQKDWDYVYRVSDLAGLAGKKYHSKRNFCSRFEKDNPGYSFEVIGPGNIEEVIEMNARWYNEMNSTGRDLEMDHTVSVGALREYRELGFTGALIRCSGEVVAWCCGEKISQGVFCTHVEKALREWEGAYAVINRDFARMLEGEYDFINREDDAGDEGLRKAKMSYHPAYTFNKNTVVISA